jgi:major intrinsic protein
MIVIGSGIQAQELTADNALRLLANSIATGLGLAILILKFGPISGAHFNPVVTIISLTQKRITLKKSMMYIIAQIIGAIIGVMTANIIFDKDVISISSTTRNSTGLVVSEIIATIGLLITIFGLQRMQKDKLVAPAVGAYITAAYWVTSSTSFANPAVTIARVFSNTFAGISPSSVLPFIAAQLIAVPITILLIKLLYHNIRAI